MEIIYGIRNDDGRVVSIDEIPNNEPGLLCNCICTHCKGPLQACSLNGSVRRYFRHHTDVKGEHRSHETTRCGSFSANETALHLMAKQIIANEKRILVPQKNISLREAGIDDIPPEIEKEISCYELQKPRSIIAENVELESRLDDFTPDVLIKTDRGELLIEIFVSHQVDEFKKEKAKERGSAMLEIDLSDFIDAPVQSDTLRSIILSSEKHKEWIYYPISKESLNNAKKYYDNLNTIGSYRTRALEEKRRREKEQADKERRNRKIKDLFDPIKYATALDRLRNDNIFIMSSEKWHQDHWFSFAQYYKQHQSVPFFIDIPITGEMIFRCDRRIWQSIIFNRYVYGRKNDGARINVDNIFDDLKDDYNIEIDYDLTYKLTDPQDDKGYIWLRREVVRRYMNYLEDIGFIFTPSSSNGRQYEDWRTVQARKTIIPPLCKEADRLLLAIQSINSHSPNVDELINQRIREINAEQLKKEVEEKNKHNAKMFKINSSMHGTFAAPNPQNKILYNPSSFHEYSEERRFERSYQRGETTHNQKTEPIEISKDQRIWTCVDCGKEKTKQAFSEFIDMEQNLGVCIMCFHTSRHRRHID